MRVRLARGTLSALVASGILLLAGCGLSIPRDPEGTLDRVSGDTLHVGVTPNSTFTQVDGGAVSGSEVDLVEDFAETIDAEIVWQVGSEEALVRDLEHHELDTIIGGLTDETPWTDKAGMTRPYDEVTDGRGKTHRLVMLVPAGENAFLASLETFLTEAGAR